MARRRRSVDREKRLEHEFETMVPVQFFHAPGPAALQPEKRLMMAVLEDAVSVSLRYPSNREGKESLAWLTSDDTSWPYSVANLCQALGLDLEAVRAALRRHLVRRAPEAAAA
jgi:hypothetical protein